MFETAELGRKVSKTEYKARVPLLRQQLVQVQQRLRGADFKVLVIFAGVDGAGKGETVNQLNEWMDPRWLVTRAYTEPSQEERERPEYWRYWRDLPPRGRVGLILSGWYSEPVLDRVHNRIGPAEFDERLDRIAAFESSLAADGALILKFWMHLSRPAQKKRLKALEKDPLLRWRVTDSDWKHWRLYDRFVAAAERAIVKTSVGHALWRIVEGADERYRSLTVGAEVLQAIEHHRAPRPVPVAVPLEAPAAEALPTVLSTLDMTRALPKIEYEAELVALQGRLNRLHREALARGTSTLVVLEGWDAAGKGGAVRRCMAALDARHCEVIPFAAPSDEERAHHYLWRFWRELGRAGRVTFFDRSWYGRVLVERVEGYASEAEWRRAYGEIVDFEEQLVEHGIVLVKFWLHITPEEQLARFEAREATPWKSWKLTDEDWRNREKWPLYEQAVNDMVGHTSTAAAPWTLVEGNDKNYARIKVLRTLCDRLEQALEAPKKG
ncbi:MAG: polyphosphate:AMP phosphotransferase [Deferrisomatales bacterium]